MLWERVRALPAIETVDHALVTEVIVDDGRAAACATSTPTASP